MHEGRGTGVVGSKKKSLKEKLTSKSADPRSRVIDHPPRVGLPTLSGGKEVYLPPPTPPSTLGGDPFLESKIAIFTAVL